MPLAAPTAAEPLNDFLVRQAIEQAWIDSQPGDPTQRHEEGGWIFLDLTTGQLSVRRQVAGQQAELDLASPPLLPGAVVVGKFHTHSESDCERVASGAKQPRPGRRCPARGTGFDPGG